MTLSIIIVNYNVKFHLKQCLQSVYKALQHIDGAEVFVVDNNSVDGSIEMLEKEFNALTLLRNKQNVGFSKANNQAIKQASGQYVLLLNPDTIVQEDTFEKCLKFMESHSDAGALGVKMIDGKGKFLPESKRAFPSPMVAFYKTFGLSTLFPGSKKFGKYHLSYLDKNINHRVEILSGAFMLIRKEALNKAGLLDESFFMYGEDIDLSYRILQAGYNNYYFADTTIIHYKGESTKKRSINYVLVFYQAMHIFAKKHFSKKHQCIFSFFIRIAIAFRASIAILHRAASNLLLPLFDVVTVFFSLMLTARLWTTLSDSPPPYYPADLLYWTAASLAIVSTIIIYLVGAYKKPIVLERAVKGLLASTALAFITYVFLPENMRLSQAVIVLGSVLSLVNITAIRCLLHLGFKREYGLQCRQHKRIIIIGNSSEITNVKKILALRNKKNKLIGYLAPRPQNTPETYLGDMPQLAEIITINKINELIFCSGSLSTKDIIQAILDLSSSHLELKIAPAESHAIIGSQTIHSI